MLAFLITFLPIISFILWIYYKDKYNRENISILLKYFILGIILSFFAIIIEKFLIDRNIFEDDTNLIYTAFVIAGCTEEILKGLEFFGLELNEENNEIRGKIQEISTEDSRVKVYVVPTNEELMIARDTAKLVK